MAVTHEIPRISPITQLDVAAINRVVNEINGALERMAEVTATLQGLESRTPAFSNDLQLNGKRICGVGNPHDDGDACPRGDLKRNGLYAQNSRLRARYHIEAVAGITVPRAQASADAIPLDQLTELTGAFPHSQAAAITALTDNTAGTANDTLQALTDPADTPATADALRDDLVANLVPELRNNLADLAAKVNEIIAGQKTANQMAT